MNARSNLRNEHNGCTSTAVLLAAALHLIVNAKYPVLYHTPGNIYAGCDLACVIKTLKIYQFEYKHNLKPYFR